MVVETYCFCWVCPLSLPPLVSTLTRKPLFRLFPNICSMIRGLGNLPGNFFFPFFSFFNKIKDGRQNLMALAKAWTASLICFTRKPLVLRLFPNICSMYTGLGNVPGNFFFAFFSFFNKIQDGHHNPMSLSRAWIALWICFMFGLNKRPYSAHVLISFWCDSDNKTLICLRFRIFAHISV